jgi:ATP-dependent DNA helicase RecQ
MRSAPARNVLRNTFGHVDFRDLQAGVVGEILGERSALAALPTGGGKSLYYQIPALVRSGPGLVVSPAAGQNITVMLPPRDSGRQRTGV